MTGGRDFSLSAPVAPERNYRKPRTNNLKAADLNVSAPVVPELKNATWTRRGRDFNLSAPVVSKQCGRD